MLTSYPQAVLWLCWGAFAFSVISCLLAWRRTDLEPLRRSQKQLKLQLDLLEAEQSQLTAAWKRTNARLAMAQARAKLKAGEEDETGLPDPKTDPEGWRSAVRQKFLIKR